MRVRQMGTVMDRRRWYILVGDEKKRSHYCCLLVTFCQQVGNKPFTSDISAGWTASRDLHKDHRQ